MVGAFDYISIINTNHREIFAFFANKAFSIALLVLISSLIIVALGKLFTINFKNSHTIIIKKKFFVLLLLLSLIPLFFINKKDILSSYPFACLLDTIVNWNFSKKASKYSNFKYSFEGEIVDPKKELNFILVIGESARRSSFGFSSFYASETTTSLTSRMDEISILYPEKCVIMNNYISTGHSTVPTILTMLNPLGSDAILDCFDKPNLLVLLRSAGFHLSLLKSQLCGYVDEYLSVTDETLYFLDKSDLDMLQTIEKKIHSEGKRFIIIHTKGSHFSSLNIQGGSYPDSIRITDQFLSSLFNMIQRCEKATCVWFVSDHGENLTYLHGSGNITTDEIEVPSIIFANLTFIKFTEKRWKNLKFNAGTLTSHYNLAHTIMGMLHVFPQNYYHSQKDLSSINYVENTNPVLIPNNMIPISYKSCMSKKD